MFGHRHLTPVAALGGFHPRDLFAGGEQGFLYDFSSAANLYQDSGGTTPVAAASDPVGKVLDLSGRGNHAVQATSAKRPLWSALPSGRMGLAFDGVDDFLATAASLNLTGTDKVTAIAGVRFTNSARSMLLEHNNAGTARAAFEAPAFTSNTVGFVGGGSIAASAASAASYAPPQLLVLTGQNSIPGDSCALRINGALVASSATDQGSGTNGNSTAYIGARNGTGLFFAGIVTTLIVLGRAVTAGELAALEAWVNAKTGAY